MNGFEGCGGRGQEGRSVFHRARQEVLCPAVGQGKSWPTMPGRQSTILVTSSYILHIDRLCFYLTGQY